MDEVEFSNLVPGVVWEGAMKRLIVIWLAAALFFLSDPAVAGLTAKELARNCRTSSTSGQVFCASYLGGALEMNRHLSRSYPQARIRCSSEIIPIERKKRFLKWLKANPTRVNEAVSAVVMEIFATEFPCAESK